MQIMVSVFGPIWPFPKIGDPYGPQNTITLALSALKTSCTILGNCHI